MAAPFQRIVDITTVNGGDYTVITIDYKNRHCRKVNKVTAIDSRNACGYKGYVKNINFAMDYWNNSIYTSLRALGYKIVEATEDYMLQK